MPADGRWGPYTLKFQFLKIHLNITLPSTHGSPKCYLSLRFPHQNPVYTSPLPHTCYMPRPSHSSDFITRTILGEQYRSLRSSLCSFLHSPVTSSLLGPNIPLSTLFSNTHSLCFSLNVNDQVPHPYKTAGINQILDFKLSPCFESVMYSFGCFPGV